VPVDDVQHKSKDLSDEKAMDKADEGSKNSVVVSPQTRRQSKRARRSLPEEDLVLEA
jgi:hypothetical protein